MECDSSPSLAESDGWRSEKVVSSAGSLSHGILVNIAIIIYRAPVQTNIADVCFR